MNIRNTKKLTVTFLACALVAVSAVGASAADPAKESDTAVSATMTKAIAIESVTVAEKDDEMQELQITRIDGKNQDGIEISVVPLTAIIEATEAQDGDQVTMKATPLVPAKVVPMEKIVME